MGFGFGWQSGGSSLSNIISGLAGQSLSFLKLTLTQVAGQNAIALTTTGARIDLDSLVSFRAYLASPSVNAVGVGANFTTGIAGTSGEGKISMPFTDTSGTPGNAAANTPTGKSAIAIGASSCVISNTMVTANSVILISPLVRDATALLPIVSAQSAGTSFTVSATGNATAALSFGWVLFG